MGPGDNSNPGMYFLIGSGTPGMYTRSGVYLEPALKRSYTVHTYLYMVHVHVGVCKHTVRFACIIIIIAESE